MGFLDHLKAKVKDLGDRDHHNHSGASDNSAPPAWTPAPEITHTWGKWNEAPTQEYEAGEQFCKQYPPEAPRLLPSQAVDAINATGCKAWGIQYPSTPRFSGNILNARDSKGGVAVTSISTNKACKDTCLLSDLPILAGLYDVQGKAGVYYEVAILSMAGFIAIGTACRPYPEWRLPGWNRLSAGLHLDDFRKFFEDPDGGRDYTDALTHISPGDTIGCGYEFASGNLFYTYNGMRLPNAFTGLYIPRSNHDVFAAIGMEGECQIQVNFGGEAFRWLEGNEWAWRVEGHVGRLTGSSRPGDDELPSYHDIH